MLFFFTTAITTLQAAYAMLAELIWTQRTQEQYAQNIKAIQTDINTFQRATTMVIKSRPMSTNLLLYAHVTAIILIMPQIIKQVTHKPTKVHKITIYIGDATNHEKPLKQNSQILIHKLQATGPPDTHKIQAIKKLQSKDVRAYITNKKNKRQIAARKRMDKGLKTLCYTICTINVNKGLCSTYKPYYPKLGG